jgi:D-erythronate 2-dehydrogenase
MHIVVTGGAGFLGQELIKKILALGAITVDENGPTPVRAITAVDIGPGALIDPRITYHSADISDAAVMPALLKPDTRLVIHLAAVVSGSAEADFDLGMRVNLDGTRHLLQACRAFGTKPRVLFTSSIAVFGGDLPAVVTDSTTPNPQGSYGIQKLIGEHLVQDFTRKGFIDGRSVRVPTVVVRPGKPNGAASGFASGIIREPLAGIATVLPVAPSTVMWLASPDAVVGMLLHAIQTEPQLWGLVRSLNLPGLSATMEQELDALQQVGGPQARALVRYEPDEKIMRLVNTWAGRFDTARALSMGFVADADVLSVVKAYRDRWAG